MRKLFCSQNVPPPGFEAAAQQTSKMKSTAARRAGGGVLQAPLCDTSLGALPAAGRDGSGSEVAPLLGLRVAVLGSRSPANPSGRMLTAGFSAVVDVAEQTGLSGRVDGDAGVSLAIGLVMTARATRLAFIGATSTLEMMALEVGRILTAAFTVTMDAADIEA